MADASKNEAITDARREYLISKVEAETDPDAKLLYEALLHGYDRGELIMSWNPWQQEMEYSASDIH